MFYLLDFCDKSYIVEVILIIKTIFKLACYLAPLIVIIATTIHLFKIIMNGKDDEFKDALKVSVKRIIAGLVIFFLPVMINYVFNNLTGATKLDFIACFDSASKEKVESLKAKEKAAEEAEQKQKEKEDEKALREAYEKDQKDRNKQKQTYEEWKKAKEERERQQQQQQSGGNGGSGGSSAGAGSIMASVDPGTSNLIIGDSRTVGMCASITGDWTKCQYSNGGRGNGADFYIAQGSMGYSWFNSTAVPAVNQVLANNPNTRYNIYSWMGANFLLSDIDKYIAKYNELVNGPWKNHKVILVSVGPVNEAIESQHGYSTKNSNIEIFNSKLKNGVRANNVSYCDIYTPLGSNFGTGDGLHYTGDTYKQIYNLMKQC